MKSQSSGLSLYEYIFFAIIAILVLFFVMRAILLTKSNRNVSIYPQIEPYAKNIKIILQMFVGFGLVFLVILKLLYRLNSDFPKILFPSMSNLISQLPTLKIIGISLIYSTAIELAYTLFTDGPDEAINPLITGLSGAVLIGVSDSTTFNINGVSAVAISVLVLASLFLIKDIFIDNQEIQEEEGIIINASKRKSPFKKYIANMRKRLRNK